MTSPATIDKREGASSMRRFRARQLSFSDGTTWPTVLRTMGIVTIFIGTSIVIHKMVGRAPAAGVGVGLLVTGGLAIATASRGGNNA